MKKNTPKRPATVPVKKALIPVQFASTPEFQVCLSDAAAEPMTWTGNSSDPVHTPSTMILECH